MDVDQVGDIENLVQTRKAAARPGGMSGCQDGDSSGVEREEEIAITGSADLAPEAAHTNKARPAKIAHGSVALCRTVSTHGPRPLRPRMWRGFA